MVLLVAVSILNSFVTNKTGCPFSVEGRLFAESILNLWYTAGVLPPTHQFEGLTATLAASRYIVTGDP